MMAACCKGVWVVAVQRQVYKYRVLADLSTSSAVAVYITNQQLQRDCSSVATCIVVLTIHSIRVHA